VREKLGEAGFALWTYWSSIRNGDVVPNRRDFDPMAIAKHLPLVSLVERETATVWRIRLVGTQIVNRSGELTGRNYLDLVALQQRQEQARRLAQLVEQPCGSVGVRTNVHSGGWTYLVRSVSLPLRAPDGEIRLLIGTNEEVNRDSRALVAGLGELRIGERDLIDIGAGMPAWRSAAA
jgi:hypothetical protein